MSTRVPLQAQNKTAVKSTSLLRQEAGVFDHTPTEDAHGEEMYQGVDHDFGKIKVYSDNRVSAPPIRLQAKLMVNQPGDQYEQEADAMADRVINMSQPQRLPMREAAPAAIAIQRKCSECEQEEEEQAVDDSIIQRQALPDAIQRKCNTCEQEEQPTNMSVMRKAEGGGGFQASPALTSQLATTKGSGTPLPVGTRSFMENAFSADFSGVRIHADGQAAEMNRAVSARAFTHGSDIYFNRGEYDPPSREGQKLLAHELTHVLQQRDAYNDFKIQRQLIANQRGPLPQGFTYEKLWEAISHSHCVQSFFEGVAGVIFSILLFIAGLTFLVGLFPEIAAAISAFFATASGLQVMAIFTGSMLGVVVLSITDSARRFYSNIESATSNSELWAAGDTFCSDMGGALTNLVLLAAPLLRPLIPNSIMNYFSRGRIMVGRSPARLTSISGGRSGPIPMRPGPGGRPVVASTPRLPAVESPHASTGRAIEGSTARQLAPAPVAPPEHVPALVPRQAPGVGAPTGSPLYPNIIGRAAVGAGVIISRRPPRAQPVMPSGLSEREQREWQNCNHMHIYYKYIQDAGSEIAPQIRRISTAIENGRRSTQNLTMVCDLIDQLLSLLGQEVSARWHYIHEGCDKFDWYNEGKTEQERRQNHIDYVNQQLRSQINNLILQRDRYSCP